MINNLNLITLGINWQKYFHMVDWDRLAMTILEKVVLLILFTILFLVFKRIGKGVINHFFKRYRMKYQNTVAEKRIKTFHTLTINILNYCLWFFWIYSILSTIGVPVGTLVASAGIFSLAIGLGAQGFVTDIVSGFFILLEKEIEVGEYVQIGTIKGTVTAVGIRTTQVVGDDGTLNFIPNRTITTIANMSRNNMTAMIQVGIFPQTPVEKVTEIIRKVNDKEVPNYPDIVGKPKILGTISLPNGKLVIQVNITTKNGSQYEVSHNFLAFYLAEINRAGIELPSSPTLVSGQAHS
ncbi:mechanosensitive ion channel family protein [Lentilactobacillus kefiri]|jgi:small-conductance mechanosensitive channel|uniref:Mechanosensitive ion channel MscS n=2 Tax=Lentilactobacillus kefiri TaxID=33962 RepID=A0A8E1V0L3_LENKE|nr:mechanosensitive ion channel family protein [Lentilactobacillus kefiri]KRM50705.1 mechanosensitive ion channel MscS [Lentilactobacillus kefiri DSM 20587 = JCM 5818]MCJ2160800.1 mechanosensitive ion channel family protein [Lentilactobacillus kefiri]MCP9368055.1 mechanosensitive ion channel family protein [Lentilactobacillus kefiri]MDH5107395.1 mechanosensitive ion channel family protein [Lentilactobacillus kefiri]MDM7491772.1 mechanosensitive ion channel family protein [Lentilactobacillus ke